MANEKPLCRDWRIALAAYKFGYHHSITRKHIAMKHLESGIKILLPILFAMGALFALKSIYPHEKDTIKGAAICLVLVSGIVFAISLFRFAREEKQGH